VLSRFTWWRLRKISPRSMPSLKPTRTSWGSTRRRRGFNWWDAPDNYGCRLAQFGNWDTAFVLPVEFGGVFVEAMKWALATVKRLAMQNRGFDIHVIESCFGVDPFPLIKKTWDTKLLAHLVDGRATKEGG